MLPAAVEDGLARLADELDPARQEDGLRKQEAARREAHARAGRSRQGLHELRDLMRLEGGFGHGT